MIDHDLTTQAAMMGAVELQPCTPNDLTPMIAHIAAIYQMTMTLTKSAKHSMKYKVTRIPEDRQGNISTKCEGKHTEILLKQKLF